MRPNRRPQALLSLPLWILLALLPAVLGARPAAPALPAQDSHTTFRTAFRKAMEINATTEMERLVKKHQPEAVSWIMETAEGLSSRPTDELVEQMNALRKAWKAAMDSQFCEKMYEYFSLLESLQKEERTKAKMRYDRVNRKYWENAEKKDGSTFGQISVELRGLAEVFAGLGDYYFASTCWLLESNCWNEANRGSKADLYKVWEACAKVCEYREKIDLKDRSYTEAKSTRDYLAAQGYDGDSGEAGEGGGAGVGPPKGGIKMAGTVITSPMIFEMVEKLTAYDRPCYYADDLYNMWNQLPFRGKGSTVQINSLGKLSPKIHRVGSADVRLDADGDGEGEVEIPLRGNLDPVEFGIGSGDEARPWGVLTKLGSQQDTYQGIQMNMIPDDNQMQIYLAPGASMVGQFEGVEVRVFDDNMDGTYGSFPLQWGHIGLTPDHLHPELDSVVIGSSKRAVPWSEYLKIGDQWYMMAPAKHGQELTGSPVDVETGKVKLSFKGGKPAWVILQGSGLYANAFFDVTGKTNELPACDYRLFYGELRKGKKQQEAKTIIIPGTNTPKWTVAPGGTTTIELGAPFGFDFQFEEDENTITVKGNTVAVVGRAGERYERPWNCVPHPSVSYRKTGTRKGSKAKDMGYVKGQDDITKAGWAAAWFPFDLVLEKKGKIGDVEVQLIEKKNKLFGKIESDWKD